MRQFDNFPTPLNNFGGNVFLVKGYLANVHFFRKLCSVLFNLIIFKHIVKRARQAIFPFNVVTFTYFTFVIQFGEGVDSYFTFLLHGVPLQKSLILFKVMPEKGDIFLS